MQAPVELAPDVFWVGHTLGDDAFQLHAYLIRHGQQSVLIDPGSLVTIEHTLAKVQQVVDLDDIAWIVCHHPDPDVAGALTPLSDVLTRPDVQLVTEWRGDALLKHYRHRFPSYRVERHGWELPLGDGRTLEFQFSPYLHFPGAFVTYDPVSATLFSSDIFGGFVDDPSMLVCNDPDTVVEAVRPFHQHYMPSGALLRASLQRMQQRWPDIARVAPQHGYVFEGAAVGPTFAALEQVQCGLFVQESADHDLQRFLQVAEGRAELQRSIMRTAGVASWLGAVNGVIARTGLAEGCDMIVFIPNVGWRRWGWSVDGVPAPYPTGPDVVLLPGQPLAAVQLLGAADSHAIAELRSLVLEFSDVLHPLVDALVRQHQHADTVDHLRQVSETDPLTGCQNRRGLMEHPPTGAYGLLAIDIDHFKQVNDSEGHQAGDRCIVTVARVLRECLRRSDVVYRIGGDEFIVVLPSADLDRTMEVAERCRQAVGNVPCLDDAEPVTLSIGATAISTARPVSLQEAIGAADSALYQAKRNGRNQIATATPLSHH